MRTAVRSIRTPGMAGARRLFAAHARAELLGMPVQDVLGQLMDSRAAVSEQEPTLTRRSFVLGGAGLLAGAALAAGCGSNATRSSPRIAIVGAGLAGLRCAHALWRRDRPIAATVYEANPVRSGGRCWTLRGFFDNGLITEHGGTFLDSHHHRIRRLAGQLGLKEEVVNGGALPSPELNAIYWIGGARYSQKEVTENWESVGYRAFREAREEVESDTERAQLDAMSVPQWLDSTQIGSSSRLGRLLLADTVSENGCDPAEQSALDLIELVTENFTAKRKLPTTDERYHIEGGNDQIVTRMLDQLPASAVRHGHVLVAVKENSDRTITMSFQVGVATVDVTADLVVLALPFSTLRDVDLSHSGLSATKRRVIGQYGMGTHAKLHVQLRKKTWGGPPLHSNGVAYGEWDSFCAAWDDSVPLGAGARPALLLGFPGGHVGRSRLTAAGHEAAPRADVEWFLNAIEPVFAGTKEQYAGLAYEDHWAVDPWVRGSYSCPLVGQATSFAQIAAQPGGRPGQAGERIHFAGEHTAVYSGFLEGAVESGERAARELLARI